ncbi:hypothetical protein PCANC_24509 [Puccinia coronata f. sp. avenae]|uniref:Secreted protein n=1 Tax=Puccinia coronata f. sp. avenae TaxID=200324 RepID=A0A2N5RV75_9BASI|nr:hypothetical protein PCANC_28318 [Puccinia coronata f. sp. avenae]PLW19164.1 hypothetical protein PCASD_20538 [Puccinia coronata f. sp. avenae]PLW26093.1 hypothetical protein PCANC_24509 [Puccinia coronata f. sp. avenae]PLW38655.1 hypothetical protein PCASD_08250 [Puccinia coronata f. sp. avenae]
MQLSNMFPVLIVVLMQGHALVQCFECTSQDYSKAACGLYVDVPGTKGSQADDPDQDGAGITLLAAIPKGKSKNHCSSKKTDHHLESCCKPKTKLRGKKISLSKFENNCQLVQNPT